MIREDPIWEVYAWKESSGKEEATEHGVAATTWWQWACPNDDCDWPNGDSEHVQKMTVTGQMVKVHNLKNLIITIFTQRKICFTSYILVLKIFWLQYTVVDIKLTCIQLFPTEDNSYSNQWLQLAWQYSL